MEVLESWYTSAQSANPDAQSVINPAAAAATAAAAGIATNPGGLLTEMGISACLAPPPRSQVCRERLLLAYEAHGGLAAALTGFRPPQVSVEDTKRECFHTHIFNQAWKTSFRHSLQS